MQPAFWSSISVEPRLGRFRTARARAAAAGLVLGVSMVACASEERHVVAAPQTGEHLLGAVRELIGPARCQTDADCRTIAIGAKACGGPQAYLAWSARATDAAALARAVAAYNQWSQTAQAKGGAMSTCEVESDPGAVCRAVVPTTSVPAGPRSCQPGARDGGAVLHRQ